MPKVSWGRANKLGDFVTMLKFTAIDFEDSVGMPDKAFSHRFHEQRLSGARRPQKEKIAYRMTRAVHPGQVSLVDADDLLNSIILTHYALSQIGIKNLRTLSDLFGIQQPTPHGPTPLGLEPTRNPNARSCTKFQLCL